MTVAQVNRLAASVTPRPRIAIIGTGISGLTVAHRMHTSSDLTLFEANDYVGGHTNTIHFEHRGRPMAVDTGFIVFNTTNYPNFTALLDELGVASQPTSMSFSVRCDRTGLEYNGTSLDGLFAQRRNLVRPRFLGMLRDILRFNREAPALLDAEHVGDATTVEQYVRDAGYGDAFVEHYLVPMGASVWSAPAERFRTFPIRFVVEFLRNHALLQIGGRPEWRTVTGGSDQYVYRLIEPFADRIRLSSPVSRVERSNTGVRITLAKTGRVETFDHVVFACHADQAQRMLADAGRVERELLTAFPYQPNEAVLHTDTSVLPRRRKAWASWNYHLPREADDGSDRPVRVTYNMNMLQRLEADDTFCVTLNDDEGIDASKVIRRIAYHHPLYTLERARAQARHREVINTNRTSFCGAYWGYGFHEDGVRSGLAVARALSAEVLV